MLAAMDATAALARNDRYLRDLVEAFQICPFARTCRERGALARTVLAGRGEPLFAALTQAARQLHEPSQAHVEVALLIAPEFGDDWRVFDGWATRLASELRDQRHADGEAIAFHVVAFHPAMRGSDDDAWRLVGLLRRSPDPTLQLVRISVLDAVKGADAGQTRYVAPEDLHRLDMLPRKGISERIAEANFATWRAHGQAMAAILRDMATPLR
jgi:hypothetical protein